jgi:molybdopterin-guanine dinucleotide biosynthesis protein A
MEDIAGVILAGGENRRFPVLKGLVRVGGERIIERTLRIFRGFFDDVIISTNRPEDYFFLGERMVGDVFRPKGPMVGIYSAIINTEMERIFVAACDMPFIKPELIRYLSGIKTDALIVVCSFNNRIHPLLGLYDRRLVKPLEENIKRGSTELLGFIRGVKTEVVDEDDVRRIDTEGRSFVNINTPGDYDQYIGGGICSD